uniref:cinnamyl-alcohol dehydrogenase n=1 Tax=Oryza rufipogon TaxID=4529 RepID=A0A0E0QR53_ORYRU
MSRHFRTHTTSRLTFPSSSGGLAITRLPFSSTSSKLLLQQLSSTSPAAAATAVTITTSSPARNLQRARASAAEQGMEEHGKAAVGWAARDDSGVLSPYNFSRRAQKDDDVTIKVLYCGICHTDLHIVKNDWGNAMYPVVPGHEIVGVVTGVGAGVTKFKAGDTVGVGYFVASCRGCECCGNGYENYCAKMVTTCNGVDHDHGGGAATQGGFSDAIVVNEHYVLRGITGNCVGGIRDCQAMLDFAGEHGITAEVEVIKMDYVNTAMERLEKNDVRYRFVIDVAGSSLAGSGDAKI